MTVSIQEAQTHFSKLVKKANEGEEIIITDHGQPIAEIRAFKSIKVTEIAPPTPKKILRQPGLLKHLLKDFDIDAFDSLDKEIEENFEKSQIFPEGE